MWLLLLLNLIGVGIIVWLVLYQKKYRLSENKTLKDVISKSGTLNSKYLKWANPYYVFEQAREADWSNFDFKKYWLFVVIGSVLSVVFIFSVFRVLWLVPLGVLAGFAVPNVFLFYQKRKKEDTILKELSSYLNSMSNMISTYETILKSLEQVRDLVEEPVRSEVDKVILKIGNGVPVREAFEEMDAKYNNSYLKLFHSNVALADRFGGEMDDVLIEIAKDYDEALANRSRLRNAKYPQRNNFYNFMKYLIAMPFILMTFSFEYYNMFIESVAGKAIFLLMIAIGIFSAMQIEKQYDQDPIFLKR